jgi:GTP-binding protein Era
MANNGFRSSKDFDVDDHIPSEEGFRSGYDNEGFSKAWEEVKGQLQKQLVMAFLGTASSGKTSAIKALFDVDLGDIHPIPGSTTEVKVLQIAKNVLVVDAPGFGDIRREISQKAKDACDSVDVFVYVINAEGGYKQQEKEDYHSLLNYGREVLVVLNKIDLIRDHQKQEFIEDQRQKMGVIPDNFVPAAFDPHPAISPIPINVVKVQAWIQDTLEKKGKDLLFAKHAREKDRMCERWILAACVSAAAIGALPIPGSDYVPLTALQSGMIAKIAYIYGHSISKQDAVALIGQVLVGGAGRQVFRLVLTLLKGVGWFPLIGWPVEIATSALAASLAASMTFGLGKASQAYYKSGMQIPIPEVQEIFKRAFDQRRQEG